MVIFKAGLFLILCLFCSVCYGELLKQYEQGKLYQEKGQFVLYLEGTPYERGKQHGILLRERIQQNIAFIDHALLKSSDRGEEYQNGLSQIPSYLPSHFIEELEGVADGSEVPFQKILIANLFPEMFHCLGVTVNKEASYDRSLYHVRVLDYSVGQGLQDSAVLMVVKPKDRYPYLNVSYAGFIGIVTGMNAQKIAIGEIGGKGYGKWNGMPMAFLLREILEKAQHLQEAKDILASFPRTCEYYYVLSDGKTEESIGVYATASQLHFIEPGTSYALMAPGNLPQNYGKDGLDDKFFLSSFKYLSSNYQKQVTNQKGELIALFNDQPRDCIILCGYSHPERYPILIDRIQKDFGKIGTKQLQEMIKFPVTDVSNLHNAIFHPSTLEVWVSYSNQEGSPASEEAYFYYNLEQMLNNMVWSLPQ